MCVDRFWNKKKWKKNVSIESSIALKRQRKSITHVIRAINFSFVYFCRKNEKLTMENEKKIQVAEKAIGHSTWCHSKEKNEEIWQKKSLKNYKRNWS